MKGDKNLLKITRKELNCITCLIAEGSLFNYPFLLMIALNILSTPHVHIHLPFELAIAAYILYVYTILHSFFK